MRVRADCQKGWGIELPAYVRGLEGFDSSHCRHNGNFVTTCGEESQQILDIFLRSHLSFRLDLQGSGLSAIVDVDDG